MIDIIQARLTALRQRKSQMEQQLSELQQQLLYGEQQVLAIAGGIQELEQLLQPEHEQKEEPQ